VQLLFIRLSVVCRDAITMCIIIISKLEMQCVCIHCDSMENICCSTVILMLTMRLVATVSVSTLRLEV
jgi:hypothetical protein